MSKFASLILISSLLFFKLENSFAQSDSLTVFVKIVGPKYEKYRFYHKGKLMIETPRGDFYLDSFKVALGSNFRQGSSLDIYITRKGLIRIGYWNIPLGIPLYTNPNKKYLVIYRDPRFKNRFPLDYLYTNSRPKKDYYKM